MRINWDSVYSFIANLICVAMVVFFAWLMFGAAMVASLFGPVWPFANGEIESLFHVWG